MKGGTNERTDGRTNERKSPSVLQDFVPFGAAAQKRMSWKDHRFASIMEGGSVIVGFNYTPPLQY